ncbi:DUF3179 domain-containing protein [Candidatus Micrarchaeota archaeon]|nr:DUF3179 domain-containing protein [Candidatus Micrarchaeota archaeon]
MVSKKHVALATAIVIIVSIIFFIESGKGPASQLPITPNSYQQAIPTGLNIGEAAPDFELVSIDGETFRLSQFRGEKAVFINFWASWCGPCREEFPEMQRAFISNKDDVVILAVNLQESEEAARAFGEEMQVTFPLFLDPNRGVKSLYQVRTQPVSFFVDKNGIIQGKKNGVLTPEELVSNVHTIRVQSVIPVNDGTRVAASDEEIQITNGIKHIIPLDEVLPGGPGKDGIPSIDRPKFVSISEADEFVTDNEFVLSFESGDEVRAYPLQILVWHEIVNDHFGDQPVVITYCPLCGTGIAFEGYINGNQDTTFGVSGKLYNSDLLMYDRATDTYWNQISGKAVVGPLTGQRLKMLPLDTVEWRDWKRLHPVGNVLSKDTGLAPKPYGVFPYGDYATSSRISFPVSHEDSRLFAKKFIFGLELNGLHKAYVQESVQHVLLLNDEFAGIPILAVTDPESKAIRFFDRRVNGETYEFELRGSIRPNQLYDVTTGSEWDFRGKGLPSGNDGLQLKQLDAVGSFWFAWVAHYPDTELYP